MGDRQQRLLWLDIPHGRVHRFDPATGSDDRRSEPGFQTR
jgi:sugar lactone lactonase YvrE